MNIGTAIKNIRRQKNLTQKELAEKLEITQGALSLYELEKREPSAKLLMKIANALDVKLEDIAQMAESGQKATEKAPEYDKELLDSFNALPPKEQYAVRLLILNLSSQATSFS